MSPKFLLYISWAIIIIISIAGIDKKLRNKRTLIILGVATLCFGLIGLIIRGERTELSGGNAADSMLGPFIYIITYALLRQLYKSIYHVEPTYVWLRGYDFEDSRKVNLLDKLVHIIPLLTGVFLPIFI